MPRMSLVSCVELDPLTFQLTVLERWSEARFLRRAVEHERQATYTLAVRVGRFHDGQHYILRNDRRHLSLFEIFGAWRLEKKLDAYIGLDDVVEHALPPVPVLPRR